MSTGGPDTAAPARGLRLAYFMNLYPSVTHSFIRREIHALEERGQELFRISLHMGPIVDPADTAEAANTFVLLDQPWLLLGAWIAATLISRPFAAFRALRVALAMGRVSHRGMLRNIAYWLEAAALVQWLRRRDIEHVHVHFGTNPASVARLVRRMGGPAYSMTVHGPEEFDAPIGLSLGAKVDESAFTVAISHYGAAQLRRWAAPAHWDKIHVVRCLVDERWFNTDAPIPPESRSLVCVGRFSPQKGHLLLVEAFARAVRAGAVGNLILVGDGELRSAIEARIGELGVAERVQITGWQRETEVREYLLGARALVSGSFAEGLPVVLMEAMALRRPVIATAIAGNPELVKGGVTGWLVSAGDIDGLAAAMAYALAAPVEELNHMGHTARAAAAAAHRAETESVKLAGLFAALRP